MRIRHVLSIAASTCVLLPSALAAQQSSSSSNKPSFGILLGTNIATISNADEGIGTAVGGAFEKKRRIGINAGVFIKFPLTGMLSLQPEAHYAQNGVTIESTTGTIGKLGVKIDYVEVPVLLRLDLGTTSSVHPFLLAGGSAAYRLKCQLSASAQGVSLTQDCDADGSDSDTFTKSDFGVVGGAGLAMSAGGRSVSLQARFTQGLANIAKNSDDGTKPKNQAIGILLGISF